MTTDPDRAAHLQALDELAGSIKRRAASAEVQLLQAERRGAIQAARELANDIAVYRRQLRVIARARRLMAREAADDRDRGEGDEEEGGP